MLLIIDAGNTRIKWALAMLPVPGSVERMPAAWHASGAVFHDGIDHLGSCWSAQSIDAVIVSNVAGPALAGQLLAQLQALRNARGSAPAVTWFAATATVAGINGNGVSNGYRAPHQLGCDRLAALVGARALHRGRDLVVATCGTATTIDALRADGRFIGGMILPGPATMALSLARGTAQLPALDLAPPATATVVFADSTEAAIRSGCLNAQAGAIERAVAAHGGAHCLLSGGAAAWVAPYLRCAFTLVDNLVLPGLYAVAASQAWPDTMPAASLPVGDCNDTVASGKLA